VLGAPKALHGGPTAGFESFQRIARWLAQGFWGLSGSKVNKNGLREGFLGGGTEFQGAPFLGGGHLLLVD